MITVISTAAVEVGQKCRASVASQVGVLVEHRCVVGGPSKLANLRATIARLPASRVVAIVDGDDWLARTDAIKIVAALHEAGAWVTYGSFRYADGRPGFAAPVDGEPRDAPWSATHLRTFRAGLFHAIQEPDLLVSPTSADYLPHADDLATMIPMLEMAGPRAVFVPEVLYVYDLAASFEWSADARGLALERSCAALVRGRPAYAPRHHLEPGSPFDETGTVGGGAEKAART
jgi:hypothetical protein